LDVMATATERTIEDVADGAVLVARRYLVASDQIQFLALRNDELRALLSPRRRWRLCLRRSWCAPTHDRSVHTTMNPSQRDCAGH
jgi:hypothetical protein